MRTGQIDFGAAALRSVTGDAPDYDLYNLNSACSFFDPLDKNVLVVGCNRGNECRSFHEYGARTVTGVDVMDEIGAVFSAPNVFYRQASAENLPLESGSIDLIYSFATMEHVPDIEASFREMARVVAPGGMIYCIAAPLWCSRSGPHWGSVFDDIPWPHLRFPKERTIEEGLKRGLSRHQVEYFLGNHCNKRRPEEYLAAASLPGLSAIRNEIAIEVCDGPPEIEAELHALGYTQQDLYGLTHTYMASKPLDAENGDRFGAG